MRIRAVIFDMDGLMFDTEDLVRRAWDFAGGRLGYEHFGDNIFNTLGKGDRDRRIYFADKYGQDFPYDQFKQDYHNFYYEEIEKKGVPVKPGLYRLLEYLYENDIPAAVATSSSRRSAAAKLEETDIEKYFKMCIRDRKGDEEDEKARDDISILRRADGHPCGLLDTRRKQGAGRGSDCPRNDRVCGAVRAVCKVYDGTGLRGGRA